jgi:hypothetical protein
LLTNAGEKSNAIRNPFRYSAVLAIQKQNFFAAMSHWLLPGADRVNMPGTDAYRGGPGGLRDNGGEAGTGRF